MIRGMISGLIWGAVFSAGLGVTLTQFGGRIDVVRTAVPPAAVDAAGGDGPGCRYVRWRNRHRTWHDTDDQRHAAAGKPARS